MKRFGRGVRPEECEVCEGMGGETEVVDVGIRIEMNW